MASLNLAEAAHEHPTRAAWITDGKTIMFAEAWELASSAAALLQSQGVVPGDRVAFVAEPSLATLVTLFGVAAAGATMVPLHPRLTQPERDDQITAASPRITLVGDDVRALLAAARRQNSSGAPPQAEASPFALLFTAGSSGMPKGVLLPARAFIASAAAAEEIVPFEPDDRWLVCMPLAHVGGLSIVTRCLLARRTVVVEPSFDPDRVLAIIASESVTRISVVPTMLAALLQRDGHRRLAGLRLLLVGGAACPRALLEECATRGIPARTTWGLTEACSMVTLQRHHVAEFAEEGSGSPIPGMEISIIDERGKSVEGEGSIRIRGSSMMKGYLGRPLLREGEWFDTGDVGRLEDDRLIVSARRSDMIITGGENVSPAEIERVLESIDGVEQAMVFGVLDAHWGQIVAAAIIADRIPAVEELIRSELPQRLASFKLPRQICYVQNLPQLPSGKLDRKKAAAQFGDSLCVFRW